MFKYKIYLIIVLTATLVAGCKTTQYNSNTIQKSLPNKFDVNTDTSSATIAKWKEVFFDVNLIELIEASLENNYDLRSALQKTELAKAGLKFNKGIRLPDMGVNVSASQQKFGDYNDPLSLNTNNKQQISNPLPDYYVGFQTAWEIDLWGKLKNKKKSAADRFIASQYGKDLIVTNLIAEIASTYFELLALDNEAKILIDNIELQQEALDLVIAQKDAGRSTELGVEMMKAQLLSSKSIQVEVRQLILETESKLSFLSGMYPKNIKRDTIYFSQHLHPTLATGIPSDLIKNRADIRQAEFELEAVKADVKAAKAAFYPTLNINSALGLQSFNAFLLLETPASITYNILGGLTAPLFNRRKLKADLMISKIEQKQAYINYEKIVINSFKEVYIAFNNIKNTKQKFDFKKEEVDILKKSIITSSELFKAGRASYLEIITSQKNTLQAQIELINFYKHQNIAIVDLYKSIGGGWK